MRILSEYGGGEDALLSEAVDFLSLVGNELQPRLIFLVKSQSLFGRYQPFTHRIWNSETRWKPEGGSRVGNSGLSLAERCRINIRGRGGRRINLSTFSHCDVGLSTSKLDLHNDLGVLRQRASLFA